MSLLRELQQRNVIRVATAYVVTSWLIIQVIETIFPAFGFGDEAIRIAVILLAIGFVPVVIGAWVFEWTPEGIKRDTGETLPPARARRFDSGIIVVLLIAVAYFAIDKFVLTAPAIDSGFYGTRSIAVMPFEFNSADSEQRFFANGVTDEIRSLLGTIRDLRVIAERSSSLFDENNMGIAEIRDRFRVGHLLEGSVRMSGNRVRVTARLVDTGSETQLWSDVYEREIDDVFRIQDDIAKNVLHNLKIELEEPLRQSRNVNPEAYALVQQVSEIFQVRGENTGARMYELATRAVELDPDYPYAIKWLAYAEFMRAVDGLISWEEAQPKWEALETRYMELAPDSGYIEASRATTLEREGELEAAAEQYLRSLEKELTDSEQLRWAGRFAILVGNLDVAVAILEHAIAIDPLNHQVRRLLSQALMFRGGPGDYDRAIDIRQEYLAKATGGRPFYSMLLLLTSRADEVAAVWADVPDKYFTDAMPYLAMADFDMGRHDEGVAMLARLEEMLAEPDLSQEMRARIQFNLATAYAWMGDADTAFGHLLPAAEHASYTDRLDVLNPVWRKITDDPRWLEYREAIGMSRERLDAIEFDPWLPE
jgi:TolB-like protein/cytochrome c-type biogenesis protein CcmH/NrfG